MANLLQETKNILERIEKTPDNIFHIGTTTTIVLGKSSRG